MRSVSAGRLRLRRRNDVLVAALVLLGALTAGCSSSDRPAGAGAEGVDRYRPPKPTAVTVTMSEYRLVYSGRIPGGRATFSVSNSGRDPHRLGLYELASDAPPIAELLRQPDWQARLTPVAVMPELAAGASGTFAADLDPPARYALVSTSTGPQGRSDAILGMAGELRLTRR